MIKTSMAGAVLTVALGVLTAGAWATTSTKVCILNGGQVVSGVGTAARGCGRFVIDTAANTLGYSIAFSGLSAAETAAHIHGAAPPGVNAGVKFGLGVGNPKTGVWARRRHLALGRIRCRPWLRGR